jgi:hypothetical protein
MRLFPLIAATVLLASCGLPPPSAEQRRQAQYDVPQDGPHPKGYIASSPPGDFSANRLRCRPNGEDTVCTRDDD